jgi:hypothetical protein
MSIQRMQKQVADLQKTLETSKLAAATERQLAKGAKLRAELSEALGRHGVPAKNIKHAAAYLIHEDVVKWDDDGESIVFAGADGDVRLVTGVGRWVKGEGKHYASPRGDAGSAAPSKGSDRGSSPGGTPSKEELGTALGRVVFDRPGASAPKTREELGAALGRVIFGSGAR